MTTDSREQQFEKAIGKMTKDEIVKFIHLAYAALDAVSVETIDADAIKALRSYKDKMIEKYAKTSGL